IIDSSWDDLVAFIDARIESKQEKALPVSQIESLIQKILENKNLIVNLPSSNVQTVQGVSQTPSVVVPEREEVVPAVEEEPQEVEEVAEAEAIPTAEQAPHAEETAEEVEEIPEVEELEEAEEAPQAAEGKGEVVEEVEAVHEAEEAVVPEAKKAEVEAETAPAVEEEPQEIEVAAEAEAIPTAEQAPHAEETAEEVEEIPQVEELEEAEEVHQVTEELEELPEVIDTTDKEAELEKVSGGSFSYASSGQFYRGMDRTLRYPQALPVEELSKDSAVDIPKPFSHEWRVIQGLISKGIIEVYPIISVLHVESPTPAVTMREGVFSVRDELLKVKETEVGDQKFRKLVDEVLKGEEKGSGSEGIENIIGVKAVELSDFAGAPAAEEEPAKPTVKGNLVVTEDGIDYDSYLLGFKAGSIGVLRSLMKVSQKMNGMYAALFGFHDGFWKPDYSLGMDLGNLSTFVFGEKDGLTEDIFGSRMVIYIKTNTTGLKVLDEKLSKSERMYMKGSMFIPVRYNGLSTCLFIGLKDHTLSVEQYFERLKEL
ncbi:MAG TPA: hypothetical protein PLG43_08390, partial [Spirochaetia bacterium]|nr:hypothetical protein [Spirochaetia bacterium]